MTPPHQPRFLYTAEQSRAVDRCAIEEHGLPGPLLMARAARAAFERLLERVPQPELLQVLCGPGNNGGDGLLLAMLAQGRGIPVRVYLVDGPPRTDDARQAAARARRAGIAPRRFEAAALEARGVVVDAMLGTGIRGAPRAPYREAIAAVNASGAPVLALDVPSGVDADTGAVAAEAVRATWTLSFITAKRGLFTARGPQQAGARWVDDLAVPRAAFAAAGGACAVLALDEERRHIPGRALDAHKGHFGRCLLVGGDHGMGGAVILAAEGALRCGVGLARVATRAEHIAPLLARLPACMVSAVAHRNDIAPLLAWADAVVIGPGLGAAPWGEQMLHAALASARPLLVDADALRLIAQRPSPLPAGSVLTPHPGEAAALLGTSSAAIQADRCRAAATLARTYAATVVLKGQGSLVAGDAGLAMSLSGNPGMASGGMGDVLSGIIGSFLAQGVPADAAARLGTELHAVAADRAAQRVGRIALLPMDVIAELGALLK